VSISRETAETVAAQALAWMAGQEDLIGAFLNATGAAADELRGAMEDPGFMIAVLDFLMSRDDWVIGFCDAHGLPYDRPMVARQALPGGAAVHWT